MKRLALFTGVLLAMSGIADSAFGQGKANPSDNSYIVDGYRVQGYKGGLKLYDEWFPTKTDADNQKKFLEGVEDYVGDTKVKRFDKVLDPIPESRLYNGRRPSGYDSRPANVPNPPSRSGPIQVPNGIIPGVKPKQPEAPPGTIFDRIKPPVKEWYENRGKPTTPVPVERLRPQEQKMFDDISKSLKIPTPLRIEIPEGYQPKPATSPKEPLFNNPSAPKPTTSPALAPLKGTPYNPPAPRSRGFGYDENGVKELAPRGVTMRVGISDGTLRRAEAPPTLLDSIRDAK